MLKKQTVERIYEGVSEAETLRLVISEASGRIGVLRTRMRLEQKERAVEGESLDDAFVRQVLYPDLVAPVVAAEGVGHWPPTADEFAQMMDEMPESFLIDWERTVYDLNSHWLALAKGPEAEKKDESAGRN